MGSRMAPKLCRWWWCVFGGGGGQTLDDAGRKQAIQMADQMCPSSLPACLGQQAPVEPVLGKRLVLLEVRRRKVPVAPSVHAAGAAPHAGAVLAGLGQHRQMGDGVGSILVRRGGLAGVDRHHQSLEPHRLADPRLEPQGFRRHLVHGLQDRTGIARPFLRVRRLCRRGSGAIGRCGCRVRHGLLGGGVLRCQGADGIVPREDRLGRYRLGYCTGTLRLLRQTQRRPRADGSRQRGRHQDKRNGGEAGHGADQPG